MADEYQEQRADLAAAFRWFARLGMAESVANHFGVAVSADGSGFLVKSCRRHFSQITASVLLLDAHDPSALQRPNAPETSPWVMRS
jgi:ribulose-5-phosphate 4-epimerase/fuculose-1-phosphate aldolase